MHPDWVKHPGCHNHKCRHSHKKCHNNGLEKFKRDLELRDTDKFSKMKNRSMKRKAKKDSKCVEFTTQGDPEEYDVNQILEELGELDSGNKK